MRVYPNAIDVAYTRYKDRMLRNHPHIYIDMLQAIGDNPECFPSDLVEISGHNEVYVKTSTFWLLQNDFIDTITRGRGAHYFLTERGRIAIALHNAKLNIRNARATKLKSLHPRDCAHIHKAA